MKEHGRSARQLHLENVELKRSSLNLVEHFKLWSVLINAVSYHRLNGWTFLTVGVVLAAVSVSGFKQELHLPTSTEACTLLVIAMCGMIVVNLLMCRFKTLVLALILQIEKMMGIYHPNINFKQEMITLIRTDAFDPSGLDFDEIQVMLKAVDKINNYGVGILIGLIVTITTTVLGYAVFGYNLVFK